MSKFKFTFAAVSLCQLSTGKSVHILLSVVKALDLNSDLDLVNLYSGWEI